MSELLGTWRDLAVQEQRTLVEDTRRVMAGEAEQQVRRAVTLAKEEWSHQQKQALETAFDGRVQQAVELARVTWEVDRQRQLEAAILGVSHESDERVRRIEAGAAKAAQEHHAALDDLRRSMAADAVRRVHESVTQAKLAWEAERQTHLQEADQRVERALAETRATERAVADKAQRALEAEFDRLRLEALEGARLAWEDERRLAIEAVMRQADERVAGAQAALAAAQDAHRTTAEEAHRRLAEEADRRVAQALAEARSAWDAERRDLIAQAEQRAQLRDAAVRESERQIADQTRRQMEAALEAQRREAVDRLRTELEEEHRRHLGATLADAEARLAHANADWYAASERIRVQLERERDAGLGELRRVMTAEAEQRLASTLAHERAAWADRQRVVLDVATRDAEQRVRARESEVRDEERAASATALRLAEADVERRVEQARDQWRANWEDAAVASAVAATRLEVEQESAQRLDAATRDAEQRLRARESEVRNEERAASAISLQLAEADVERRVEQARDQWRACWEDAAVASAVAATRLEVEQESARRLDAAVAQVREQWQADRRQLLDEAQRLERALDEARQAELSRADEVRQRGDTDPALQAARLEAEARVAQLLSEHERALSAERTAAAEAQRASDEEWTRRLEALDQEMTDRLHQTLFHAKRAWQAEHERALTGWQDVEAPVAGATRPESGPLAAPADTARGAARGEVLHLAADRGATTGDAVRGTEDAAVADALRTQELDFERRLRETLERARIMWEDERQEAVEAVMRDADERMAAIERQHATSDGTTVFDGSETGTRTDLRVAHAPSAETIQTMALAEGRVRSTENETTLAVLEQVLESVERIDRCKSLRTTVDALAVSVGAMNARAMVFLVRGGELCGWRFSGMADVPEPASVRVPLAQVGTFARAVASGQPQPMSSDELVGPLAFARLAGARSGLAVPVLLADATVAIVYTEQGGEPDDPAPTGWSEVVQVLARHASRHLEALTAAQTTRLVGA